MEKEIYDREWLINNKFPHLEKQIRAGDFKLLIDGERKIARFTNMFHSIYAPDGHMILFILNEFFAGVDLKDITFMSYGLGGMDITTNDKKVYSEK